MRQRSALARQVLRWSAFLTLPGALWAAIEMYGLTLAGPQMLFFSIVHTMPLLVIAILLAVFTGAGWLAQSAVALAWPNYRRLLGLSPLAAGTFVVTLSIQAALLTAYDDWSSMQSIRVPLCILGIVAIALLVRETWRSLRRPGANSEHRLVASGDA